MFPLFVSSRQTGRMFKAEKKNSFFSFSVQPARNSLFVFSVKKNQMLSQATLLGDVFNQQFNASWPVDVCVMAS